MNTWEPPSNIDKALVASYEGIAQTAPSARQRAPALTNRGQGAARAILSGAEQRRGGAPSKSSMVCGNIVVKFRESRSDKYMPKLSLTFKVLTMDDKGHITFPTEFSAPTQAALRLQARALLQKMVNDSLNPCNESMEPALTGTGTSSIWQGPPKRTLVVVQPGGAADDS